MNGKKGYKNLKKSLRVSKFKLIGLDSNVFIYHLHGNPIYAPTVKDKVFTPLLSGLLKAVTSMLTLTEVLALQAPDSKISILKQLLLSITNVTFSGVDQEIALKAADIRREYGF